MLRHHRNDALILHVQHIIRLPDNILIDPQNFLIVIFRSVQRCNAICHIALHLRKLRAGILLRHGVGQGYAGAVLQHRNRCGDIGSLSIEPEILRMVCPKCQKTETNLFLICIYRNRLLIMAGRSLSQLVVDRLQLRLQLLPPPQAYLLRLQQRRTILLRLLGVSRKKFILRRQIRLSCRKPGNGTARQQCGNQQHCRDHSFHTVLPPCRPSY